MLEFDFERNRRAGVDPDKITAGSHKMVHWVCTNCPKGQPHLFVAGPQSCIGLNSGCSYCTSKKACICNSLQSLYPALAAEYDTARNGVGPEQVLPGSKKVAFWKDASGHTWEQSPFQRTHPDQQRSKRAFVRSRDNLPARLTAGLASRAAAGAVVGRRAPKASSQASMLLEGLTVSPTVDQSHVGFLSQAPLRGQPPSQRPATHAQTISPSSATAVVDPNAGKRASEAEAGSQKSDKRAAENLSIDIKNKLSKFRDDAVKMHRSESSASAGTGSNFSLKRSLCIYIYTVDCASAWRLGTSLTAGLRYFFFRACIPGVYKGSHLVHENTIVRVRCSKHIFHGLFLTLL
ncbi:TPA: hypothetical protein ACH3X3_004614 [Trebouxia sp. C0006]